MGKYDDMAPEELREQLLRFARLILRLEDDGVLLARVPAVLKLIGDLRQMLFAYEVRCAAGLGESGEAEGGRSEVPELDDPVVQESYRVVKEALERQGELLEELEAPPFDDEPSDD